MNIVSKSISNNTREIFVKDIFHLCVNSSGLFENETDITKF